jgi:hypothetical protein
MHPYEINVYANHEDTTHPGRQEMIVVCDPDTGEALLDTAPVGWDADNDTYVAGYIVHADSRQGALDLFREWQEGGETATERVQRIAL